MPPNQDVLERMQTQIEIWQASRDQRSVFLGCYQMMTRNMLNAVDAGEFQDAVWVHSLLMRFADYYFEALDAYEHNRPNTPKVWRTAHDATLKSQTHALQRLILGVNAHINYDLVLTLVDLLRPEWPTLIPEKRALRHADHRHVNDVIGQTIDAVQDQILEPLEPGLDLADKLLGRMDEWLISRLIIRWREEVWDNAQVMLAAQNTAGCEEFRCQIEDAAQQKAEAILLRSSPLNWRHLLE